MSNAENIETPPKYNDNDIPADPTTTASSKRACSRKNRVFIFREFLLKTYNPYWSTIEGNTVILDVAGGKGDVSWLLINADGMESIVVDPRPLSSTNHLIRSVRWLHDHPGEAKERALPHRPTHQPLASLVSQIVERSTMRRFINSSSSEEEEEEEEEPSNDEFQAKFVEPQHMKIKLDNDLIEALRQRNPDGADCPESWKIFWNERLNDNQNAAEGNASEPCFLPESERNDVSRDRGAVARAPQQVQDASKAWNIFQSIRLVLGFHADQATEACVDLADLLQIPVCIVPCCVFPSEFPDREILVESPDLWNGGKSTSLIPTRVRDYQQFLQYLQQKHPRLRKDTLAFHQTETSRNVVLYTLPEDID